MCEVGNRDTLEVINAPAPVEAPAPEPVPEKDRELTPV